MKKSLLLWILCILLTACTSVGISPTSTSTLIPVPSSMATSTPQPQPTETPSPKAIPTEVLSPQEQLERDYGALVPKDEKCVQFTDASISAQFLPSGATYAVMRFRATDKKIEHMQIPFGPLGELKDVAAVQATCRDNNGELIKYPVNIVVGTYDSGKYHDGINPFWDAPEGGNFDFGTPDQILKLIKQGDIIEFKVLMNQGNKPKDFTWRQEKGPKNEMIIEAYHRFSDINYQHQLDLLIAGIGVEEKDFNLIPIMLTLYTASIIRTDNPLHPQYTP